MIILLGKTSVGKDSVINKLVNDYNYSKIVSYTTRPQRESESNGKEYHFISKQQFLELQKQDYFVNVREYNVVNDNKPDIWYYGFSKQSILESNNKSILIADYKGFKKLSKIYKEVIGIYITAPKEIQLMRLKNRGDNILEAQRRVAQDEKDFLGIENDKDICIIENKDLELCIDTINYYIEWKLIEMKNKKWDGVNFTEFNKS